MKSKVIICDNRAFEEVVLSDPVTNNLLLPTVNDLYIIYIWCSSICSSRRVYYDPKCWLELSQCYLSNILYDICGDFICGSTVVLKMLILQWPPISMFKKKMQRESSQAAQK